MPVEKASVYKALQSSGRKNPATVELYSANGRVLVEVVDMRRESNQIIQTSSLFILQPGEPRLAPVPADLAQPGKVAGNPVYVLSGPGFAPETIFTHYDSFLYVQASESKPIP